jgi:hypothetical protein
MVSKWEQAGVLDAVVVALREIHVNSPDGHHFGRSYATSYQIAIKIDAAHPEIREMLGSEIGGAGTGAHYSFSQYLGRQLSGSIKRAQEAQQPYPVEGAFLSNDHLTALAYRDSHGKAITSSVTGTGFDLALFRLRD